MDSSTLKNLDEKMTDCKNQAANMASNTLDKGRASVATLVQGVGDMATAVAHGAGNLAAAAGEKVDQAAGYTGRAIESLADGIRQHTPDDGMVGAASNKAAASLKSGGAYLQEQGVSGMIDDAADLVRRNPLPAVFLAFGVGFVLARAIAKD